MRRILIIITIISISIVAANSQDVIYKTDGTEIQSKIIELTVETIKYKSYDQPNGPIRNILLSEVFMIIYENGNREVFKKDIEVIKEDENIQLGCQNNEYFKKEDELSTMDKCAKGQNDADMFHGKKGSHVVLGILFGGFAVLGAAVTNPTPEKGINTQIMSENKELFNDPSYRSCYIRQARKNNTNGALIGWGSWVLFLLLL